MFVTPRLKVQLEEALRKAPLLCPVRVCILVVIPWHNLSSFTSIDLPGVIVFGWRDSCLWYTSDSRLKRWKRWHMLNDQRLWRWTPTNLMEPLEPNQPLKLVKSG